MNAGGAILQALGVGDDVEPSLSLIELRRGDRVLMCSDGLHGLVGDPALAILMSPPHTVAASVKLLVAAARAAGGTDNITAIVAEVGGERLAPPKDDDDLPRFREFDPQREGDPALTSTSYVAQRLAQKIGIGAYERLPSVLPVTGQHAVVRAHISPRVPTTALPVDVEDVEGPARRRLEQGGVPWWAYVLAAVIASAAAWVLGGR
jgi:hypothetical protein